MIVDVAGMGRARIGTLPRVCWRWDRIESSVVWLLALHQHHHSPRGGRGGSEGEKRGGSEGEKRGGSEGEKSGGSEGEKSGGREEGRE